MSKKIKHAPSVIRELFTNAFFKYHLKKMSITEFLIRFIRIDLVSRGNNKESQDLLKILRNYKRDIKEDCECQQAPRQLSLKEFLKQRKNYEKSK